MKKRLFFLSFFVSIVGNVLSKYLTLYAINNKLGVETNPFQSSLMGYSLVLDIFISILIIGLIYFLIYWTKITDKKYVDLFYLSINLFLWYDVLGDYYVVYDNISMPFGISLIYAGFSLIIFMVLSLRMIQKRLSAIKVGVL